MNHTAFTTMAPEAIANAFVSDHQAKDGGARMMAGPGLANIVTILTNAITLVRPFLTKFNIPWEKVVPFFKDLTADLFAGDGMKAIADTFSFLMSLMTGVVPTPTPASPVNMA